MSTLFVDTSALGRRYLAEVGSAWVADWIIPEAGNVIIISELTTIELIATLSRIQRQGLLSAASATLLQNNFLLHIEQEYLTVFLDRPIVIQARTLVSHHKLRTLDALQLACAIDARSNLSETLTLISGDNDLLTAAAAEGFTVDNPYLHP